MPSLPAMDRCFLLATTGSNPTFFERGLLVTLKSLERTNPGVPVVVFYDNLNRKQLSQLDACYAIPVEPDIFDASHRPDLSQATFFRFYLSKKLGNVERIAYVDSDAVVLDDISPAFETNQPIAATRKTTTSPDGEFLQPSEVATAEGFDQWLPMLAAAFVVFDGPYWKRHDLLGTALKLAKKHGWNTFRNSDQGILNLLTQHHGGFHDLGREYHFWPVLEPWARLKRNRSGLLAPLVGGRNPARIIHWAGPNKPWLKEPLRLKGLLRTVLRRDSRLCYRQFL